MLQREEGMDPVSLLLISVRYTSFDSLPSELGMVPCIFE